MSCNRVALAFALFAAPIACGDPLVGENFLGTAVLTLAGVVQQSQNPPAIAAPEGSNLSLFWVGFDSRSQLRPVIEQRTEVDAGLASFSMSLFDVPPADALTFDDLSSGAGAHLGIALIVLYADNNLNGVLNNFTPYSSEPDTVLGASARHLVVYASRAIDEETDAGQLFGAIDAGYHLFATTVDSACRFIDAETCAGEGSLVEVFPGDAALTLTLYADPSEVIVPSPALAVSSGTAPGNIYGPR